MNIRVENLLFRPANSAKWLMPVLLCLFAEAFGSSEEAVARMDKDVEAGKPLVAHVVVALCDNVHQGIVPVSKTLGNGDAPRTNLYWGAMYGVKTFFSRHQDWKQVEAKKPENPSVLDRVMFTRKLQRNGRETAVYVVADAWRGKNIREAIEHFLYISAGGASETISAIGDVNHLNINAGGASHVIAYVGHNGLMDFSVANIPAVEENKNANSAVILACASNSYFSDKLARIDTHALLTTNGLMAPEAYTLEAVISNWFAGESSQAVHEAAATAYSKYQKASKTWTRTLFSTE